MILNNLQNKIGAIEFREIKMLFLMGIQDFVFGFSVEQAKQINDSNAIGF